MKEAAWLRVLRLMAEAEDRDDFEGAELVAEGLEAWLGTTRVSRTTVRNLNVMMAISHQGRFGQDKLERYRINETGRNLIKRPHPK